MLNSNKVSDVIHSDNKLTIVHQSTVPYNLYEILLKGI